MKIFQFWAKKSETITKDGQPWDVHGFGASNVSLEDALQNAAERARKIAQRLQQNVPPDSYFYSDRPLREEILEQGEVDDEVAWVLTRNAYGSVVLNTASVLFADIDYPRQSMLQRMKRWFGRSADDRLTPDERIIANCRQVADRNGLGLRLYRTRAGYRAMVTDRTYDPAAEETQLLLNEFGSDPLYVKLCRVQESFRARLSPKAWRCGAPRPPHRYPWATPEIEQQYREWERRYAEKTRDYATCRLVEVYGKKRVHPLAARVTEIHDRTACMAGELA